MTFDRLLPNAVVRAQVKGLTNGESPDYEPDWVARTALVLPLLLFIPAHCFGWKLAAPDALLAGVSLLAGALVGSFGFIASLRLRLIETQVGHSEEPDAARDSLDETVAHLLAATLACVLDAVALVIGMNVSVNKANDVVGFWAAVAIALSAYVAVVFYMLVTRLYAAYVHVARPRTNLDGTVRGHR
jgi:DMSO reductase anchor subunit